MKHVSCSPLPSQSLLTANEKDFSLSLEMTIRGKGFAIWKPAFSLLPPEGGAPKGRRLAHDTGMRYSRIVHVAKRRASNKKGNPISEISFFGVQVDLRELTN